MTWKIDAMSQIPFAKGKSKPVWYLLLVLAFVLLPYESLKILPSTYRPISLAPLVMLALFCIPLLGRAVQLRTVFRIFLFGGYALIVSLFQGIVHDGQFETLDFSLTLLLGVAVYIIFYLCLSHVALKVALPAYLSWFSRFMSKIFWLPLAVGIAEVLSLYGFLPGRVNEVLIGFFGARQNSRVCLTTYEASWASMQLLFFMPMFLYQYLVAKEKKYAVSFIIAAFLLFATGSSQGVITLVAGLLLGVVFIAYARGDVLQIIKKSIPLIIVVVFIAISFVAAVLFLPNAQYVVSRITGFTNITELIHEDGSAFIRICYPLFGFCLFAMSPVIGTGGGSFSYYLPDLLNQYAPWAISSFPEVAGQIVGTASISTACLYTRIIGELGLIGIVLFCLFLMPVLRNLKLLTRVRGGEVWMAWVAVVLCLMLQFQSFCYLPFWLALAFLSSISSCKGVCDTE